MSRLTNTIRNAAVGFGAQLIIILLNFINRTFFIQFLGAEYLGLSGLFSNILSMLSLAELGIGVAISFSLYKPLQEQNIRKTKAQTENKQSNTISSKRHASEAQLIHKQQMLSVHYL